MIKFENTEVMNFEGAFRGMRNPLNSWDKADSAFNCDWEKCQLCRYYDIGCDPQNNVYLGKNDLDLAQRLIKAGTDHRKFLRQIFVSVDITAPLYWWKEFDTYKVSTVANSCSTMHKIHSKPIELSDFSIDDFNLYDDVEEIALEDMFLETIKFCEILRRAYLETKDKRYWRESIHSIKPLDHSSNL